MNDLVSANEAIAVAIISAISLILKGFWDMWVEVRGKKKSALQKISDERDECREMYQKVRSERDKCRIQKQKWKESLWDVRRIAMDEYHVPKDALPQMPHPTDDDKN